MKKIFWFGTGCMILALLCLGIFLLTGSGSTHYYTQVDSRRPAQGKPRNSVIDLKGGMDYYYTLTAWDENGRKKEITFGTSKILREGAYLCLTVMPIRGVTAWSEVPYEELPPKVQSKYDSPSL